MRLQLSGVFGRAAGALAGLTLVVSCQSNERGGADAASAPSADVREAEGAAILSVATAPDDPDARTMTATIYDDGIACPGGCDAHVVLHKSVNGAGNAYAPPISSRLAPQKCRTGETCIICFGVEGSSCMEALYRGTGPPIGRFDFTPAFYEAACAAASIPDALAAECRRLESAIERHRYDERLDCLSPTETYVRCTEVAASARETKRHDAIERDRCLALGDDAYNVGQADAQMHRTLGCNYFLNRKGQNSSGDTWRLLTPAACRPDTYVGRNGLDCCASNLYGAAALHPECSGYFLERTP